MTETDISFRGGDTLAFTVPKRPQVSAPKFGAWLQLQRGDRSLEQIAQRVRPLVHAAGLKVDQSQIYKAEQGRVPNWPLLGALAHVYGVSMDEITRRLWTAVEFSGKRDLLGHDADQGSALLKGRSDVPASAAAARVLELERELAEREQFIEQLQAAAISLYRLFQAPAEDRRSRTHESGRRSVGRKVGR